MGIEIVNTLPLQYIIPLIAVGMFIYMVVANTNDHKARVLVVLSIMAVIAVALCIQVRHTEARAIERVAEHYGLSSITRENGADSRMPDSGDEFIVTAVTEDGQIWPHAVLRNKDGRLFLMIPEASEVGDLVEAPRS